MPTSPLKPVDTRALFRPLTSGFVPLLRGLAPEDWLKPTIAGTWLVRDVVAHMVDLMFRRLSFHRDAMTPPPPSQPIRSERDFIDFINGLNAEWVGASKRFSPRVLTDLFERAGADLSDWFAALPLDAPALFGVSWAGEMTSEGWFDVGREFVEIWHHQQQVRLAVGAPLLTETRFLRPVIEIAMRALPHKFSKPSSRSYAKATFGHWQRPRAPAARLQKCWTSTIAPAGPRRCHRSARAMARPPGLTAIRTAIAQAPS